VVKLYTPHGDDRRLPLARRSLRRGQRSASLSAAADARLLVARCSIRRGRRRHGFENFSEDFAVWVFFYGPEGGEGGFEVVGVATDLPDWRRLRTEEASAENGTPIIVVQGIN